MFNKKKIAVAEMALRLNEYNLFPFYCSICDYKKPTEKNSLHTNEIVTKRRVRRKFWCEKLEIVGHAPECNYRVEDGAASYREQSGFPSCRLSKKQVK